jgi:hypothetical protein
VRASRLPCLNSFRPFDFAFDRGFLARLYWEQGIASWLLDRVGDCVSPKLIQATIATPTCSGEIFNYLHDRLAKPA